MQSVEDAGFERVGRLLAEVWRDEEPGDLSSDATPLPPPPRGYEILGRLGEGGMGTVWRARQLAMRREVALKLMHAAALGGARARARFEREVELTARLEHPHIARVYDSGVRDGVYFYAMELVEGVPLDRFARDKHLGRRDTLQLMRLVCLAVQHAHQRGVIHRDLKFSNVLVSGDGQPHVLDFGLAKALPGVAAGQTGLTLSGEGDVAGTVGFMAPEQAAGRGAELDTRSDVYALGVILYRLLTGRPPHDLSGPPLEVMRRVAEAEVLRPRKADPTLDGELEAVLLKALAREPAARYPSAAELAGDLERYLRGDPVTARPPTLAYFVRVKARRHRAALSAAASAVAVMVAMAGWSYLRVARERDFARSEGRRAGELRQVAEHRLADALLAQADAMAESSHWVEATKLYREAGRNLAQQGRPVWATELRLLRAYEVAPPPLLNYAGHHAAVTAVAFSSDSRRCAGAGADGTILVWDVLTGRQLSAMAGHERSVTSIVFSPDGGRLVSGSLDGTVRVWDTREGSQLHCFRHGGALLGVDFAPAGDRVASAGSDGSAAVWGLADSKIVCRYQDGGVTCVAFSPDGRACASGCRDGATVLWDSATGRPRHRTELRRGAATAISFSPEGRTYMVGREGVMNQLSEGMLECDTATGEESHWVHGTESGTVALRCVGDGVAWALGRDGAMRLIYPRKRTVERALWGPGPTPAAFSRDGRFALSGHADGLVRLWPLDGDGPLMAQLSPPKGTQISPGITAWPDGSRAAVPLGNDLAIRDLATGYDLARWQGHHAIIQAAAVSGDGRRVLTGDAAGVVRSWDGVDWSEQRALGSHDHDVRAVGFSPDGRLAVSLNGNVAKVWDMVSRRELREVRAPATFDGVLSFSADGRTAWSLTDHGTVAGYEVGTGKPLPTGPDLDFGGRPGRALAFRPDLSAFLGNVGRDLVLWDFATGRRLRTFSGHVGNINATAFTPDGRLIASGGVDNSIRIWDADCGDELTELPAGAATLCVGFCDGGRKLLSFNDDWQLRVWELDRPAKHRDWEARVAGARDALQHNDDPASLATLGQWYAFRRQWAWAAELLTRARAGGADVPSLTLARCLWMTGDAAAAGAEFRRAMDRHEAAEDYLRLCAEAAGRDAAGATRPSGG